MKETYIITLISYLFLILLLHWNVPVSGKAYCEYDPEITISDGMENTPDIIYLYTSFLIPTQLGNNSVILLDRHGKPLNCISAATMKEQKGYQYDQPWQREPAFFNVKLFEDDIMVITMQKFFKNERVYMNDFFFVFMDMNFNPIPGMPDIFPNMSSTNFNPHFNIFPHDYVLVNEKYIMVGIYEYIMAYADDYFPGSDDSFRLYATSYMIVDRQTSQEVAAMNGFYFFFDPDNWFYWLCTRLMDEVKRHNQYFHSLAHISSLVKVPGEHWDSELAGLQTYLCSTRNLNSIDLWVWDFENGEDPYFIWRLPHLSSGTALHPWLRQWEIINDPQFGPTHSHDINTYNEEPKHMLVHDNGDSSRYDAGNGMVCPMTRAIEYKVDYNANGIGYHRLTLVWSYPPNEILPPVLPADIKFSDMEGYIGEKCIPWYYGNTFVFYGSSLRRLIKGQPFIGHGAYSVDNYKYGGGWPFDVPPNPYSVQKYRVYNQDTGEIVGTWNSTLDTYISFRVVSVTPEKVTTPYTGEYSHQLTLDLELQQSKIT